jgi:hypothetical protein
VWLSIYWNSPPSLFACACQLKLMHGMAGLPSPEVYQATSPLVADQEDQMQARTGSIAYHFPVALISFAHSAMSGPFTIKLQVANRHYLLLPILLPALQAIHQKTLYFVPLSRQGPVPATLLKSLARYAPCTQYCCDAAWLHEMAA